MRRYIVKEKHIVPAVKEILTADNKKTFLLDIIGFFVQLVVMSIYKKTQLHGINISCYKVHLISNIFMYIN